MNLEERTFAGGMAVDPEHETNPKQWLPSKHISAFAFMFPPEAAKFADEKT